MKILQRGAEANISCKDGVVVKDRVSKGYRETLLDETIRKSRTKAEAKLISDAARAGVRVPKVFDIQKYVLEIEHIKGGKLKNILTSKNMADICKKIGISVAKLHNAEIIHGDLTTSNMIFSDNEVYFIDFGLGFYSIKVEDMATDLNLLKEAFESTHYQIADDAFSLVLESYIETINNSSEVMERLKEIGLRGRYVKR
ncbi:MAG: Kae1-associated serine/threonine protein kinase [DPANN group archaeon]|nr:Kae1-associated serine/threonine protein kinase [DPANN group archaeon]